MKITDVRAHLVYSGWRNWVIVEILTDEGLIGLGEASLFGREKTVAEAIHEQRRYLIGQDPAHVEKHWQAMYVDNYWRGGPILCSAISGIEQALWDIKGKALGVPVYSLLGGACHDKIKVYANGWFWGAKTPEALAERAISTVEQGYKGLKWDPFGDAKFTMDKEQLRRTLASVEAVRGAVGDKIDLMIEGHGRFNCHTAMMVARHMEPFDPYFFEEPVPPENINALVRLALAVNVPIAAGERLYTKFSFAELLNKGGAAIIQPDVCNAGGIMECKKIAAMAEAHYVSLAPHNPYGPVATAASVHLAACTPNFLVLELLIDIPGGNTSTIVQEPLVPEDGYIELPTKPGLGIELDKEALAKYPYNPVDMDHYLPSRRMLS